MRTARRAISRRVRRRDDARFVHCGDEPNLVRALSCDANLINRRCAMNLGLWIALGVGIGAATGSALNQTAMGVAFGTAWGVAFGLIFGGRSR